MSGGDKKNVLRFSALIVASAAALARIAYLTSFSRTPFFDYYPRGFDQYLLLQGALEIAGGNLLGPLANEKHAALYKYLLAIPFSIFGGNFWAIWCFQFAIGVLIALVVYDVGKRCFGRATGLFAGLWYALYGPALFFEGQIVREQLLSLFVILSVYFLIRAHKGNHQGQLENGQPPNGPDSGFAYKTPVAAAVTLSLAMQTRPNAILIFPFALFYLWLMNPGLALRRRVGVLLRFSAVFVAVSIPMLARTIWVFKRLVFYDESGPFVLLLGNLPDYGGVGWEISPLYQSLAEKAGSENAITWRMTLSWLFDLYLSNPLALPAIYLRKLYFTFNSYEYPSNLNYYMFIKLTPLMKAPWSKFSVLTGFGVIGMAISIFGTGEQKGRAALYMVFIGALAGIVLFYPVDRFRMPLAPLLMVLGAFAAVRVASLFRNRNFIKALIALAGAVGIAYALKIPQSLTSLVRPEDFLNMGWAYMENPTHQDYKKAEYYLIQSWNESANRGYPINRASKTIGALERLLAAQDIDSGQYGDAVVRLKRAEYADLCSSETLMMLSMALRGMGLSDQADEAETDAAMIKETLPKERHLELVSSELSRYELDKVYCHLLAAAVLEEDPALKKEIEKQVAEIYGKIQIMQFDTSRMKTPEY